VARKSIQVGGRVQQTIDVIDAQTIQDAGTQQLKHQLMGMLEYIGQFDAQASEIV